MDYLSKWTTYKIYNLLHHDVKCSQFTIFCAMRKRSISRKRRTNESKGGNTHKYFSLVSKVNCRKIRRKTSNCETNFCLKGLRDKKRERNLVRVATYCTVPARSPRRLRLHARQILVLPFLIVTMHERSEFV